MADNPPAYGSDNPPSYDSIFGKVQKAKEESDGNVDYACKVFGMVCCGTIATIVGIALCLTIPIASIVIGAINLKNCTIERYIPIYLVVAGVFGVIKAISNTVFSVYNKKKEKEAEGNDDEEEKKKNRHNPLDSILNCFLFAWFIAGSVWVYSNYGDVDYANTNSPMYCDKTTYLFTFWVITISYIFMALALLCCCVTSAIMCCVACKSGEDE